jgi:hypothetical protein
MRKKLTKEEFLKDYPMILDRLMEVWRTVKKFEYLSAIKGIIIVDDDGDPIKKVRIKRDGRILINTDERSFECLFDWKNERWNKTTWGKDITTTQLYNVFDTDIKTLMDFFENRVKVSISI